MTGPAEQPPVEIADEMRLAAYRAARAMSQEIGHGLVDDRIVDAGLAAVAPLIAAQVRAQAAAMLDRDALSYDDSTATDDERNVAHGLRRAAHLVRIGLADAPASVVTEAWDAGEKAWADGALAADAVAESEQVWTGGQHRYLSTGCLHGRHDYCTAMTGYQGQKRAATCKFCDAHCVCDCHDTAGAEEAE